jgi:DNA repair protein RecO (recombination protein O)
MIVSTKAIVLSKLKFKDQDLIVKCYTASNGVMSFLVKGVFSSKKGKLKPAYFQPLSMLQIEVDYKTNKDLHYFKNVRLLHSFKSLHTQILKSTVVIFLAEILNTILKEEEPNSNLFAYIETTLLWFDTVEKSSMFHYKFLIGLTKYIGFSPEGTDVNKPYFNLEEGKYQKKETGQYCISGEQLFLFNSILGTKFDIDNEKLMSSTEKQELLNIILEYFKLHLQSFKSPKSLAILNQVFS